MRIVSAHIASVLMGSLILMSGLGAILIGPWGLVDGAAKWVGGLLIFGVLSVASIPVGMLVRYFVGKLNIQPVKGAVLAGVALSLGLMFVLHPAFAPGLSVLSAPFALTAVHAIAGGAGGFTWWMIEQPRILR